MPSRLSSRQIPDLLQTFFVAELITPVQCVWLVSPWISDISAIDNTANTFLCLEPSWSRSRIRYPEVVFPRYNNLFAVRAGSIKIPEVLKLFMLPAVGEEPTKPALQPWGSNSLH